MDYQTQKDPDSVELTLISQALAGDKRARNRLLTCHVEIIQALVRRKVPWIDVEDVTQEAALTAIAAFPTFRGSGSFSAWLRTITRRAIADYHQGRDLATGTGPPEFSEIGFGERGAIEGVEDRVDVEAAWAHLSQSEQVLMELRIEQGLSFAEMGKRVGASEGAAKMRFQRAKLKIFADWAVSVTFWVEIGTYLC